ncbi:hypothetical protein MMC18_004957 [Xylographa bjoerkii]|nr:hypothetical protein [Xylographa bjoerkii]
MKLIIAGASGFVGTELVRQSLSIPKITSVIALARRHIQTPSNLGKSADTSKFHSVVIDNYDTYTDDVMKRLASADACIWTVAITPIKSRGIDFEEIRRVCYEYTLAGLQAMFKAHNDGESKGGSSFRFLYMSGAGSERDQSKTPRFMPQYDLMRGDGESGATILSYTMFVPKIDVRDISAAMLHQVIHGFEKEPLENNDLVRIGRQALKAAK